MLSETQGPSEINLSLSSMSSVKRRGKQSPGSTHSSVARFFCSDGTFNHKEKNSQVPLCLKLALISQTVCVVLHKMSSTRQADPVSNSIAIIGFVSSANRRQATLSEFRTVCATIYWQAGDLAGRTRAAVGICGTADDGQRVHLITSDKTLLWRRHSAVNESKAASRHTRLRNIQHKDNISRREGMTRGSGRGKAGSKSCT